MSIYLPVLDEAPTTRDMLQEFRGYNHNLRIQDNEFYDMKNMSGALYPVLSPRKPRGRVRSLTKPNGLFAHEKLCWVDGTDFYYDGEIKGQLADSEKTFVTMGAYIVIFPDKMYYNTHTGEMKHMGAKKTTSGTVTARLCKVDGSDMNATVSSNAPASPTNGQYWIDTSVTPHVLKQYSTTLGMWSSIPTAYTKITATGIGIDFAEYDGVTISGMTNADLNGEFVLQGVGDNYIVVTAMIEAVATQTAAVTVERTIPDMDYVTESENRLWGCSSENHEIYASKQGDPTNFKSFLGISTDSYALTIGSEGDFTGCCTHLGYVLFFKENVIHKLYGSRPANYQLTNTNARGVEKGSAASIVVVNETLYYKAKSDVCAYASALPESVSSALGNAAYKRAAAGACGPRYYICMEDAAGAHSLFVFDTLYGTWHKEDDTHVKWFATLGSDMYYINGDDNCLYSVGGNTTDYADETAGMEGAFEWYVETGDIGISSPDNKYISKIALRLEADDRTLVRVQVKYDGQGRPNAASATDGAGAVDGLGDWEEVYRVNMGHRQSYRIPLIPRRCDTMRIRLWGEGDCRVYSMARTYEQGSDE